MTYPDSVTVIAPARLHMGFLDLSGALGRQFGSIGVALNEITTTLTIQPSSKSVLNGVGHERAKRFLGQLCQAMQVSDQLAITIKSAIPEHVGLGSGTQMALAIGSALNAYYGLKLSVREIASVMERGLRSGIGIGVFEYGGLVVDGGRGEHTITPPVLVHLPFPDQWRFILVFDQRGQGLHGESERAAFAELPDFPEQQAQKLCYRLLMQGLPALAEQDLIGFGSVITQLQQAVGEHFAPAQGGVFASIEVQTVITWLAEQGAAGFGQTSWGPTGFCIVSEQQSAENLIHQAQQKFSQFNHLSYRMVSPNNYPAATRIVLNG